MSPEQKKARKLIDRHRKDMWHDDHAAELCAAIARALRAERNAALERAARWAQSAGWLGAFEIRSLKHRAPKRKADARPERLYIDRVTPAPKRKAGR